MGWDLSLHAKPCEHCGRADDGGSWNYTSNTNPMLRAAGLDIHDLDGRTGADCAEQIGAALALMDEDPAYFRAMNPSNGWGDYDRLRVVLEKIRAACLANPDGVMRGSF